MVNMYQVILALTCLSSMAAIGPGIYGSVELARCSNDDATSQPTCKKTYGIWTGVGWGVCCLCCLIATLAIARLMKG